MNKKFWKRMDGTYGQRRDFVLSMMVTAILARKEREKIRSSSWERPDTKYVDLARVVLGFNRNQTLTTTQLSELMRKAEELKRKDYMSMRSIECDMEQARR